jgi:PRTRC genetic system protein B
MNAYIDIGGSEVLTLKGALLVYRGRSRGFVSWHEIRRNGTEGAPFLGEAQEVTTDFVHHLAQGLRTAVPAEIFPENVLARTAEVMAWWTPASVRPMFFAAYDPDAYKLNGQRFFQPPLVWKVRDRDLWIRALQENRRPAAGTPLMIAPYWNVDGETGWICQGSMRWPDDPSVNAIPLWERAFFQSEFTHHTGTRRLTTHPDGFLELWSSLAGGCRKFPAKYLTPANERLCEFVLRR